MLKVEGQVEGLREAIKLIYFIPLNRRLDEVNDITMGYGYTLRHPSRAGGEQQISDRVRSS